MATHFTYRPFIIIPLLSLLCYFAIAQQRVPNASDSTRYFSVSGFYYFIPEDKNEFTFIATADHKKLHLETRYNYEDRRTGSVFAGWRFKTNGKVQFEAIPLDFHTRIYTELNVNLSSCGNSKSLLAYHR